MGFSKVAYRAEMETNRAGSMKLLFMRDVVKPYFMTNPFALLQEVLAGGVSEGESLGFRRRSGTASAAEIGPGELVKCERSGVILLEIGQGERGEARVGRDCGNVEVINLIFARHALDGRD